MPDDRLLRRSPPCRFEPLGKARVTLSIGREACGEPTVTLVFGVGLRLSRGKPCRLGSIAQFFVGQFDGEHSVRVRRAVTWRPSSAAGRRALDGPDNSNRHPSADFFPFRLASVRARYSRCSGATGQRLSVRGQYRLSVSCFRSSAKSSLVKL